MNSEPVILRTMLGIRGVDLALKRLGSIQTFCRHPLRIVIHEDGTLDAEARARLEEKLPGVGFENRAESDERAADLLRVHPRCRAFRDENMFGLKLFDVPLFTPPGKRVIYMDTDIVFTRPLLCDPFFLGGAFPFTAMCDLKESYAVPMRQWHLLGLRGIRLASRICAGMISFDRAAYDLDYIEWLLKVDSELSLFRGFPFWAEQTMYAAQAARAGCGWVEPGDCLVAHRANMKRARQASIIHFAGFSRPWFEEVYREIDFTPNDREPRRLEARRAPVCGVARRLASAFCTRVFWREEAMAK